MPGPMRDSLSRCDSNPYSIYDVRKHSTAKNEPTISNTVPKDTIELTHEKLKKEALNRLQHTSKYLIVQEGFMRVGKYVFLSLALPPYLLLYGLPKWVLSVALPYVISFGISFFKKVAKPVQKKVTQVVQVLLQKIQNNLAVLIQPIIRLALDIKNAIQKIRQNVARIIIGFFNVTRRPVKSAKKAQEKALGFIKKELFNFIKGLRRSFDQTKEWVFYPTVLFKKFLKGIVNLKNLPARMLMKGQDITQRMFQTFTNLANDIQKQFQNSKKLAGTITQWVFKYLEGEKAFLNGRGQRIKGIFVNTIYPSLKTMSSSFRNFMSKIASFLNSTGTKISSFVERGLATLKSLSSRTFFSSSDSFSNFPRFIRDALKKFVSKPGFQKTLQNTFKAIHSVSSFLWRCLKMLVEASKKIIGISVNGLKEMVRYTNLGLNFCVNQVSGSLSKIRKVSRICFYHFLVFLIMLIIITIWSIRLLAYITAKILMNRSKRKLRA